MKIVTLKDYLFSLSRGNIFESIKIIFNHLLKKSTFIFLSFLFLFKTNKIFKESDISKIAIYFPVNSGLGDLIMANLFFKLVREKFPLAKILVFTKNGLFIKKSYYDELIDISHLSVIKQILIINSYKIDLLLLPEKSIKSSFLFVLCNAKYKLGYLNSYQLKANFRISSWRFIPHKHHYYLKSYYLVKVLQNDQNIDCLPYSPDLSFLNTKPLNQSLEYILFIPCTQWENRSISFDYAKLVLEELLKSRFHIFLSGGKESLFTNQKLVNLFEKNKDRIIFQEKLNLDEFVDMVRNSKAVICSDGGPMHIAYGFQIPVLSFWGPTFPELRVPDFSKSGLKSKIIFEKQNCKVTNCYNMEHKPFCKTCLRLDNISDFSEKVKTFVQALQ